MDPDCQTDIEPNDKTASKKLKRKCLIVILIIAALWGFLLGILPEDFPYIQMVDAISILLFSLLVLTWCLIDSEDRNFKISLKLSILIFLVWSIGFQYYIFRTRKRRTALVTLCLAALFAIVFYGIQNFAYWVGCCIYDRIYI